MIIATDKKGKYKISLKKAKEYCKLGIPFYVILKNF
ncbi:MAG: hypothetical protein PWQ43_740 [Rikenellaceae bacterium]|nr:hypothetical protein [Rikenellaceae bacterium]